MWRRAFPATVVAALVTLTATGCSSSTTSQPRSTATGPTAIGPTATGPTAQPALWPTYHRDLARTGAQPSSPEPGAVRRQWTSSPLDGAINGEPLVVNTTVIAATENNTVYALDAASGAIRWSTHLGTPMAGSDLPCGDIDPSGITSTPVIDSTAGLVWVVAFVRPGIHQLVELDLTSGAVRSKRSVDAPGANPLEEQQRGALTLANGQVYVPYGGLFGDCGGFHGYLVSLPERGQGQLASWKVPTTKGGGLWSPPGPVIDSGGQVFVTTGNTESMTTFDEGNAVVRLSATLGQADVFAPTNWVELNAGDTDLGSVSPTLLPGGGVFQIGKEGIGYLLDGGHLGGVGGQRFSGSVCNAAFGGTAVSGSTVFVPCRDGLVALRIDLGATPRFATEWRGPSVAAGSPVLAGGWVWFVDLSGDLYGLDQTTGAVRFRDHLGSVAHFPSLAVGAGQLFAATTNRVIAYQGI
jgi:outer membrane protein assembly factor BamB